MFWGMIDQLKVISSTGVTTSSIDLPVDSIDSTTSLTDSIYSTIGLTDSKKNNFFPLNLIDFVVDTRSKFKNIGIFSR